MTTIKLDASQLPKLIGEVESYAQFYRLETKDIRVFLSADSFSSGTITLMDKDWSHREQYGEHTNTSPQPRKLEDFRLAAVY